MLGFITVLEARSDPILVNAHVVYNRLGQEAPIGLLNQHASSNRR